MGRAVIAAASAQTQTAAHMKQAAVATFQVNQIDIVLAGMAAD
jgi:hypothetical protein